MSVNHSLHKYCHERTTLSHTHSMGTEGQLNCGLNSRGAFLVSSRVSLSSLLSSMEISGQGMLERWTIPQVSVCIISLYFTRCY